MGSDLIPALTHVSPLMLAFSPDPDKVSALSLSFMTGEPAFSAAGDRDRGLVRCLYRRSHPALQSPGVLGNHEVTEDQC